MVRDCACRGTAGYVHKACLVAYVSAATRAAPGRKTMWIQCGLCKQLFHGGTKLALAQARYERAVAEGCQTDERMDAGSCLAATHFISGSFERSNEILVKVVADRRSRQGQRHPETLNDTCNLGRVALELGNTRRAERLASTCLANGFGGLKYKRLMVDIVSRKGDNEKALEMLNSSILSKQRGKLQAALDMAAKGRVLARLDRGREALRCYRRALNGVTEVLGADHPSTKQVRRQMVKLSVCN